MAVMRTRAPTLADGSNMVPISLAGATVARPLAQPGALMAAPAPVAAAAQPTSQPAGTMTLAQQIRAQYGGSGGGSGNWDDAGYDRAQELADLLGKAGVTQWGDLSFKDTTTKVATERKLTPEELSPFADAEGRFIGLPDEYRYYDDETRGGGNGGWYKTVMEDNTQRQLMIGDKAVGYLGDYNNDGTYGSKASEYLRSGDGTDPSLLAWSARGDGNTGYRIVTDPATGKLVISPSWGSSSDADKARKAAMVIGTVAAIGLGGAALAGSLGGAGAGAASATASGSSLAGGATNAALIESALGGAGYGASSAGLGGAAATNWGAIGASALKKAAINGGMTLLQGGSPVDALKSAAIGGATGGVGSYASGAMGLGSAASGALSGATGSLLRGGGIGDIATGALQGGASGFGKDFGKDLGGSFGGLSSGGNDMDFGASFGDVNYDTDLSGGALTGGGFDWTQSFEDGGYDSIDNFDFGDLSGGGESGGILSNAGSWLTSNLSKLFTGTGGTGGTAGGFDPKWLSSVLGLVGAGVQQMNIEKVAKDQRDWIDGKENAARRRRAPVGALKSLRTNVIPGGS